MIATVNQHCTRSVYLIADSNVMLVRALLLHQIPMPIPKALRMRISETVEEEWRKQLAAAGPVATRKSWAMIPTLEWVESKFSSLLSLVPDLIEAYEGCDDAGASMRRYTIVAEKYDEDAAAAAAAAAGVAASHDGGEGNAEEEFDDGLDDEERARRAAVVEEKRARKAAEEEAKEREKYAEAERKRILALEKGITLEVKPQQVTRTHNLHVHVLAFASASYQRARSVCSVFGTISHQDACSCLSCCLRDVNCRRYCSTPSVTEGNPSPKHINISTHSH